MRKAACLLVILLLSAVAAYGAGLVAQGERAPGLPVMARGGDTTAHYAYLSPETPKAGASVAPAFTAAPAVKADWIDNRDQYESRRYSQGVADGKLIFRVEDAGKAMRWLWRLPAAVDPLERGVLVLDYRAEGVPTEKKRGYETILWLRDGRPYGGFFAAIAPADINADGKPHKLQIDLEKFNPVGPLTEVCIEVRNAGDGPALFEIAALDFVVPPLPPPISVLNGNPFEAMTEWARGGNVSADFSHTAEAGMALFEVKDANAHMKWALQFDEPIDWRKWPVLELEYNATGLVDDGYEYLVWLFDGRPEHAAGFEAIIPREIRTDGRTHKFYVRLARFNVAGPITGAAVRVLSNDTGGARLMITKLEFLPGWPAEAAVPAKAALPAQSAVGDTMSHYRPARY